MSTGDHVRLVVSTSRELGYPIWLMSRKNWSTKSRASWKLSSFTCSLYPRCCASFICERTPAEMTPIIATTSIISISENPYCRRRARFRVFMSIPLPDHRANRYRRREQHEVIVRASQLRRNSHQLAIRRRRLDIPPDVISGLPAAAAASVIKHVIARRVAGAARGLGEDDVTAG